MSLGLRVIVNYQRYVLKLKSHWFYAYIFNDACAYVLQNAPQYFYINLWDIIFFFDGETPLLYKQVLHSMSKSWWT